jgi:hypothetical protein
VVTKKSDAWIEIPAETPEGYDIGAIQLRPGTDETKVQIRPLPMHDAVVSFADLEAGLDLIRKEHAR